VINYSAVLQIIQKLNSFAENADGTIQRTWAKFNSDKSQLARRHEAAMSKLSADFNKNKNSLNAKAKSVLAEAEKIHQDILKLDTTLTAADKYYVKTKKKKEEELASSQSEKHTGDTDIFESLKSIRDQYQALTAKYSQDILPAIINGINYIFSSKRKKDYEELIVLKNTVEALIKEINQTLPELTRESISELDASLLQGRRQLNERNTTAENKLAQQYTMDTETLAELICEQLDEILPDAVLMELAEIMTRYQNNLCKVNTSRHNDADYFILGFFDYPLGLYVQSPILLALVQDKCTAILIENQTLRFPILCPKAQPISWMVKNDGTNNSDILQFVQSIMLEFLSEVPVTQLSFSVIDPENRGNSIATFFDLKKKLPELFDEKIFVTREEILKKLNSLNEYIDQTLQNRVGSRHETIFDYEKENPDYQTPIQLLAVYDFPKGFDEPSLAALRNVLRNGYKCGVYTSIYQDTINSITGYNNIADATRLIDEMCVCVKQEGSGLFLSGLDVTYTPLPQKQELGSFFNKYLLIYEGIKNKGLAFPAIIKKLMDTTDSGELENHINAIVDMMRHHDETRNVPEIDAKFPYTIMLGTVAYPMDIFGDSRK